MPQARGSDIQVLLFEESVYATVPGSPAGHKLLVTGFNIQKTQPLIRTNVLGQGRDRSQPGLGNIDVTGTLPLEIGAEDFGMVAKHLMGTVATSGAGPYEHVFTPGDLPVGLHIERDHGSNISGSGRFELFEGCRIGSGQFAFPVSGPATCTVNVVGSDVSQGSATIDASPTDNGHTSFFMAEGSIEEGGSAFALATNVTLNVDNGLDTGVFTIGGGGTRRSLPEGFVTVSGTLDALFEDVTLLNKALGSTESSLKVILTRGDGLGSAGNERMEWLVNQLKYSPATPPVNGPGGVAVSLSFEGYLSGATESLSITIDNAVTSY